MYKNKINTLSILVLLIGVLFTTSCDNKNNQLNLESVTVSEEEIKEKVATLEKLKKVGELESGIDSELENIFNDEKVLEKIDGIEEEHNSNLSKELKEVEELQNEALLTLKELKRLLQSGAKLEDVAKILIKALKAEEIRKAKVQKLINEGKLVKGKKLE